MILTEELERIKTELSELSMKAMYGMTLKEWIELNLTKEENDGIHS